MPIFAGRDDLDHPLQLKITYPYRHSRIMSLMRLSGIGIFLITLPHLIILFLLNLSVPISYFIGQFSVIITGRWPHFLYDFLMRYFRYGARVFAFIIGLVEEYPSFKFN
jgi:hypothetical protein